MSVEAKLGLDPNLEQLIVDSWAGWLQQCPQLAAVDDPARLPAWVKGADPEVADRVVHAVAWLASVEAATMCWPRRCWRGCWCRGLVSWPASGTPGVPDGPVGACPASGSGAERGLQPAALHALRCVKTTFPWITSMGGLGSRPNKSDHPAGRAVDFMIPAWNTPDGRARGWQVAHWLQTNAATLNVKYIIFDDRVWRSSRASAGWTPYTHPNGPTSNVTLRHLDHVHLSVAA